MNADAYGPIEAVAWVLDFIYTDLTRLDGAERLKLSIDLDKHLLGMRADKYVHCFTGQPKGLLFQVGLDEEEIGHVNVESILSELDLEKIQAEFRKFIDTFLKPLLSGEGRKSPELKPLFHSEHEVMEVKDGFIHWDVETYADANDETLVAYALENFRLTLRYLAPFPIDLFLKCEGCGRYFLPVGKGVRQKRRFCTRGCNLRYTARRYREEDPEGYRAKQRKFMRERYAVKKNQ